MNNQKPFPLKQFEDFRGTLTVLEDEIPFPIKRIYWIYGADEKIRGGHRHKITQQALIAISGTVDLKINNGSQKTSCILDDSLSKPIFIYRITHNIYADLSN